MKNVYFNILNGNLGGLNKIYCRHVGLTSSSKFHQQFGESSREQEGLPGVWEPLNDLLKLLSKTHFKQPEWKKEFVRQNHVEIKV